MPCLAGLIAIFAPRVAIVLIVIFSDWLGPAYKNDLWAFLGFLFLPFTTLAYALAWHSAPGHSITGLWIVLIVIAVLVDLGSMGGGGSSVRSRRKVYIRSD
ncbi:MAG: hypothetical protein IT430_07595 [Phycisphaerales bacterium]|nr:hypothetical protein [Phycisphaerales bacterium]